MSFLWSYFTSSTITTIVLQNKKEFDEFKQKKMNLTNVCIKVIGTFRYIIEGVDLEHFKGCKELDLSCSPVFDCSIQDKQNDLSDGMEYLEEIETINLANRKYIKDDDLKHFKKVKTLNIYNCEDITDEGLKYPRDVENLNIGGCQKVTSNGLQNLEKLKHINVYQCKNIFANQLVDLRKDITIKGFYNDGTMITVEQIVNDDLPIDKYAIFENVIIKFTKQNKFLQYDSNYVPIDDPWQYAYADSKYTEEKYTEYFPNDDPSCYCT